MATTETEGKKSGKVALITGASSGIGAATAILFSKLGARLALTGRNSDNLTKVGNQCLEVNKKKSLLITADLSEEEDTKRVLEETIKEYGKLDILINCAGILELGNIENTSLEQFDRVMNINFPGVLAYNLSKSALDQFTRCIALELAPKQVRVNGVNPGVIITEIHKRGGLDKEAYAKFLERSKETHALGSTGAGRGSGSGDRIPGI